MKLTIESTSAKRPSKEALGIMKKVEKITDLRYGTIEQDTDKVVIITWKGDFSVDNKELTALAKTGVDFWSEDGKTGITFMKR